MSFLSGIVNFGKAALSGNSWQSSLVKTVALGYAVSQLSSSAKKSNGSGGKNIDEGVRLQIPPASDNKVPVLYGDAYFGGVITDAEMTPDNKTMYYCLTLSERTGNKLSDGTATSYNFRDVYWNDQRVVFRSDGITVDYSVDRQGNIDRSLSGFVKIYFYAGSSSEGVIPENYTGTVPNAASVMPSWDPQTHLMSDLVFAVVRVDYNRERGIQGIGDLTFQVASDMIMPGDVLYDYMTNTLYGAGIEASKLDTSKLGELNTYSAQSVSYNDEATGPATLAYRYQINGVLDTAESVLSNAELVASSAATWISYDIHQGLWTFVINKPESSVASFNDSNILSNISLQGAGIQELYNTVKVEFPHRELRDSADFVSISIPQADRLANEVDNRLDLGYDLVNEPVHAEQLGLIELKQARVDLMISFSTDYSYVNLNAGDVIDVTNSRYGYANKLFRVITVEERQDDAGALTVDILALEYDANVYDVSDITRFVRSNEDGIITIGSIGVPGTPQVSKVEVDARPRVIVETTTPSGIVDGLEYWLSNDVNLDEENRSYRLVAERRPTEDETFPSGTPVTIELDSIPSSDFVIKIRAFNTLTVGPYTTPSGLIEFRPTQTTDAIGPDTSVLDDIGNIAIALTVIDLLKLLDDLYAGYTGGAGLFEAIFDKFEDVTGVDILGDASDGSLVVSSDLITLDNGVEVSPKTNSYNFTGAGVEVTSDGSNNITVDIPAAGFPEATQDKDIVAWNEEAQEWQVISGCISCDFPEPEPEPEPGEPGGPPIPCKLEAASFLPNDTGWTCYASGVPYTGSYFIIFDKVQGKIEDGVDEGEIPYYAPLELGTGSIYLYTSDGVLQQSILASSCTVHGANVLEITFGLREPGTDYYILTDPGIVTACECESLPIEDPTVWNFTTNPLPLVGYGVPPQLPVEPFEFGTPPTYPAELTVVSVTPNNDQAGCNSRAITVTFSEPVESAGGNIEVIEVPSNSVVATISFDDANVTFDGNVVTTAPVSAMESGKTYKIRISFQAVATIRPPVTRSDSRCSIDATETYEPPQRLSEYAEVVTYIKPEVRYSFLKVCSDPWGENVITKTSRLSTLELNFTGNVFISDMSPANLHIYSSDGALHQTIDLSAVYPQTSDLYRIGDNKISVNPTRMFDLITNYYVLVDDGVIIDECDNPVLINDPGLVTFKTEGLEVENTESTPPTSFGSDGSQTVAFELESADVAPGDGFINIYDDQGTLVAQLPPDHPAVSFSDTI